MIPLVVNMLTSANALSCSFVTLSSTRVSTLALVVDQNEQYVGSVPLRSGRESDMALGVVAVLQNHFQCVFGSCGWRVLARAFCMAPHRLLRHGGLHRSHIRR
jgi:hypothetical protein